MICFRCNNEIGEENNYYTFTETNNKNIISTDYAHKECWDNFLKGVSILENAQKLVDKLQKNLKNIGSINDEEDDDDVQEVILV